ncbi:M20 family metallopeptidase [Thermosulfuriphilus sp.]
MNNLKERLKDLIFTLASIPSPSGQEGAILEFIWNRLSALGIPLRRQDVPDRFYNLLANEARGNRLLITAHVDTVPHWLGVFPPRIRDDRLEGLGVCDDKAGVAIMVLLLEERLRKKSPLPVTFAFVVDEEREGQGSATLSKEDLPPLAVVLEPTELKLAIAEGGSVEFEIHIRGRSAHGSCHLQGENAIDKAIELVGHLKRLPFLYSEHPLVGPGGLNVERITGGDGELRVPDLCTLEIDFRVLPGQETGKIIEEIKEVLESFSGVSYVVKDVSEPFALAQDSSFVKMFAQAYRESLGEEPRFSGMPSWTDAAHLQAAGLEALVFGPGELAPCHTPEEYLDLGQAEKAYKVLDRLIDLLAEGG